MSDESPFPGRRCLDCGATLDDQTGLNHVDPPDDGDVSVCLYCGAVAFYAANVQRLRRPTPTEEVQLAMDPDVVRARAVVSIYQARSR